MITDHRDARILELEDGMADIIEECLKAIVSGDHGMYEFAVAFILTRARIALDGTGESS